MIIHTRYRDIPWEEVRMCINSSVTKRAWEKRWRGSPIQIIAPPPPYRDGAVLTCEGPHYPVVGQERHGVCPHIAEIGD